MSTGCSGEPPRASVSVVAWNDNAAEPRWRLPPPPRLVREPRRRQRKIRHLASHLSNTALNCCLQAITLPARSPRKSGGMECDNRRNRLYSTSQGRRRTSAARADSSQRLETTRKLARERATIFGNVVDVVAEYASNGIRQLADCAF